MIAAEPRHTITEYAPGFRLVTRCTADGCLFRIHIEKLDPIAGAWRPVHLAWLEARVIGHQQRIAGTSHMVAAIRGILKMYDHPGSASLHEILSRADESRHVSTSEKVRRWPPNKGAWYGS